LTYPGGVFGVFPEKINWIDGGPFVHGRDPKPDRRLGSQAFSIFFKSSKSRLESNLRVCESFCDGKR
jgi:hypothetical protein